MRRCPFGHWHRSGSYALIFCRERWAVVSERGQGTPSGETAKPRSETSAPSQERDS